jgi:hypothetical protein
LSIQLNPQAFDVTSSDGSFVLKDPVRAKNTAKEKSVRTILESGDSFDKQAHALQSTLVDPQIAQLLVTAGFKSKESYVVSHFMTQVRDILSLATMTTNKNGRPSDDKRGFAELVGSAMVSTLGRERDDNPMSLQQMEFLGINNRKLLEDDNDLVEWLQVRKKSAGAKLAKSYKRKCKSG